MDISKSNGGELLTTSSASCSLKELALNYASAGFPVFPCGQDKQPIILDGLNAATTDPAQVGAWWDRNPGALIGLPTGERSGLWVLDLDREKVDKRTGEVTPDGRVTLEALGLSELLDEGVLVTTQSGGMHAYFRDEGYRNTAGDRGKGIGKGIDTRGEGGYAIAPGSTGYAFIGDGSIERLRQARPIPAPLKARLDERIAAKDKSASPANQVTAPRPGGFLGSDLGPPYLTTGGDGGSWAETALAAEIAELRTVSTGGRNHALNEAAFSLGQIVAGGGLDRARVVAELTNAALIIGLTPEETAKTIASGLVGGAKEPRTAPMRPQSGMPVYTGGRGKASVAFPASFRRARGGDFAKEYEPADYLVDGSLRHGWLYTFTAPTGHGKTAVTLALAFAVATGDQVCGQECKQGRVLYLAGENPDDVRARWIAMCEDRGVDPKDVPVDFAPDTFSVRNGLAEIAREYDAEPLALVIVDTLAAYFDGDDLNSNAQQQEFATSVLRELTHLPGAPCVVVPAHPTKGASKRDLVPMGGSALLNQVDGNLSAWNTDGTVRVHWQGKFRGAPWEPLVFKLEKYETPKLVDRRGRIMPTVIGRPMLLVEQLKAAKEAETKEDRALAAYNANPKLTDRGLADALGCAPSTANAVKTRLLDAKWVVKRSRAIYLTDEGKEVLRGD